MLDRPLTSCVHPTVHVSQLKRKLDFRFTTIPNLLPVDDQGILRLEQEEVLGRRMVKAGNRAKIELLVHWQGWGVEEMTWEGYSQLKESFPHLAGKVF